MPNTFKNQLQAAVGTSPTTIYTAGAGVSTTVIGMTIANILNTTISTVSRIIDKKPDRTKLLDTIIWKEPTGRLRK